MTALTNHSCCCKEKHLGKQHSGDPKALFEEEGAGASLSLTRLDVEGGGRTKGLCFTLQGMLLGFVNDTQSWLREYHKRSIIETINSTMKRTLPYAIKKKLVDRKTTEMLAKIIVYNIRQLVYLHYTKGIDTGVSTEPRQVTLKEWFKRQN